MEIRDTIFSTFEKYVDPDNNGNYQEIFKPDPHVVGYVQPLMPTDLAGLLSKGEIYTSTGHKFFPPEGNVYNFTEGSITLLIFLMVIMQVENILDDLQDVIALRFTEVAPNGTGTEYVTVTGGIVTDIGVRHDDELYQMKHYPVDSFVWNPPGEVYDIKEYDVTGIDAGLYSRSESDGETKLTPVLIDDTTTTVTLMPVIPDSGTSEANDYSIPNGATKVHLTSDQLASFQGASLTADGFVSSSVEPNLWSEIVDGSNVVVDSSIEASPNMNPWMEYQTLYEMPDDAYPKIPVFDLAENELGTHAEGKYALTNVGTDATPIYKIQNVEEDVTTYNTHDFVYTAGSVLIDVTNATQADYLLARSVH